jgi:polyphenol oxidase
MTTDLSTSTPAQSVRPATLTAWEIPGLRHGFMGRLGGVSSGRYATFNLAEWVGDDSAAVRTNWDRWHAAYPATRVARLSQVHGKTVHTIDANFDEMRHEGDGMVTPAAGILLGIFSADCVPILMVDAGRGVACALHAGWRGTLADIANEGVRAMKTLGARVHEIRAATGPAIDICCFEVDQQLADRFAHELPDARAHMRAGRPGKAHMDLRAMVHGQLQRSGLDPAAIKSVGPCTRCANGTYFSRRAAGGATTGLQMSFIGFEA